MLPRPAGLIAQSHRFAAGQSFTVNHELGESREGERERGEILNSNASLRSSFLLLLNLPTGWLDLDNVNRDKQAP